MRIKFFLVLIVCSILSFSISKAQNGASGTQGFYLNYNDFVNSPRAVGGDCDIDVNGYLQIGSKGILNIFGAVRNKGVIEVDSGGQLTISGDLFNEGTIIIKKNAIVYFYGTVWKNTSNAKVLDGTIPNTVPGGLLFFDNKRIVVSEEWLTLSPFLINYSGENSSQYLEGANVPMDVDVHLSNPNNVFLTNSPARIEGKLTWDVLNSNVILGDNDLIFTQNATQSGYNPLNYAVTNGAGHLVKENYTGKWVFPVGKDLADYTPAQIENTTANTMHVAVQDYATSASVEKTDLSLDDGMDRTWNIYADIPVGVSSITLQHNKNTNRPAFKEAYNFVTQWSNFSPNNSGDNISPTAWQNNNAIASVSGNLSSSGIVPGASMNTRKYSNFATKATDSTAFYTKASSAFGPASVELLSFIVDSLNCEALIKFRTGVESNISKYQVQHSTDSLTFTTIATFNPRGNSSSYDFLHETAAKGKNYYRIVFIEPSGDYSVSHVISTTVFCIDENPIILYPNPARDRITIANLKGPSEIRILNTHGRVALAFSTTNSIEVIDISMLPVEHYFVKILDTKQNVTGLKFLKN